MTKLTDKEKDTIEMYFKHSLFHIEEGIPKIVLEDVLKQYELEEDYLACAGVKKALDSYDEYYIDMIMKNLKEMRDEDDEYEDDEYI